MAFTIDPKTATPTALPMERAKMFAPVTTPRRSHPTTDCTATTIELAEKPSPSPTTKPGTAMSHTGAD